MNAGYAWRRDKGTIAGDLQTGLGGNGNFVINNAFYGQNYNNTPASAPLSLNDSGAIGGGQVGYNWMLNPKWVVGVELDLQKASIKSADTASTATGVNRIAVTSAGSLDWFATARGRLGYLLDRNFLLFGTAGWAYGQTSLTTDVNNLGAGLAFGGATFLFCGAGQKCMAAADTSKSSGLVLGGGAEWALLPSLTLRAEYLHVDLGSQSVTARMLPAQPPGNPPAFVTSSVNNSFDMVRTALNYRF